MTTNKVEAKLEKKMKQTVIFDMHKIIYRSASTPLAASRSKTDKQQQPDKAMSIEAMPEAIETFVSFYQQGYQIVIISSSSIQHSRHALSQLLEAHQVPNWREILDKIDILTMQFFGSKHDADAWKKAMKPYKNISYIFEDGEQKLKAAGQAARELGSDPDLYTSVEEFAV